MSHAHYWLEAEEEVKSHSTDHEILCGTEGGGFRPAASAAALEEERRSWHKLLGGRPADPVQLAALCRWPGRS